MESRIDALENKLDSGNTEKMKETIKCNKCDFERFSQKGLNIHTK